MQLALGFVAAVGAAACYDTAYALQALEARRAPARHALRVALLGHLVRRPLWIGAIALSIAGWPLQLVALSFAPLTLVQPTLALGLLLLLALGVRVLGEQVGRREVIAVLLIVGGVAGMAAASPARSTHHAGAAELVPTLAVLGAVALAPYVLRRRRSPLLVLGAGAGDAFAAFTAKLVVDELSRGRWLAALGFAVAAGLAVGAGLLSEMTALQSYPATRVGPVVLVLQIVVPVLLAPLVGGERWGSSGPLLAVALAAVACGAALLASSPAVGELEHERRRRGESGEGEVLRFPGGEGMLERGGEPGS
jgi:drug/metabolite transporter (DMT)-like permease